MLAPSCAYATIMAKRNGLTSIVAANRLLGLYRGVNRQPQRRPRFIRSLPIALASCSSRLSSGQSCACQSRFAGKTNSSNSTTTSFSWGDRQANPKSEKRHQALTFPIILSTQISQQAFDAAEPTGDDESSRELSGSRSACQRFSAG